MNDLDTLRPEVREAVGRMVVLCSAANKTGKWVRADCDVVIVAEMLRLAEYEQAAGKLAIEKAEFRQRAERAEAELDALKNLQSELAAQVVRAEYAEAELVALKARTAESPIGMVMGGAEGNQDNTDSYRVDVPIGWESSLADRRVRLVVED